MHTCEYAGEPFTSARSHPWTHSRGDESARYYDFSAHPALIRSSLEDFLPWRRYPAVEDFYALLELLNRRTSLLESNDCTFIGPAPDDSPQNAKAYACSGRLMVLFRALPRNRAKGQVEALCNKLHRGLSTADPAFRWGMIGTTLVPVRFLALPEGAGGDIAAQSGQQLMISFWAFGDDEADTMSNLRRLLTNLTRTLRTLSSPAGAP